MAIKQPAVPKPRRIDKHALQQKVTDLDARMGVVRDPTATAEKAQKMTQALGIRPEDCAFSREIIRLRYEDEEE